MAKVLIIDGYNIIGAQGRMRRDRAILEQERLSLVRDLEIYAVGSSFSEILVVFDGYPTDRDVGLFRSRLLRIHFSEGAGTADRVIVELSRKYRERAAVVSSDREVVQAVTSFGSESVSAQGFLSRFRQRTAAPRQNGPSPSGPGFGKDEEEPEGEGRGSFSSMTRKKGNPHRLSKKERAQKRLFDKL